MKIYIYLLFLFMLASGCVENDKQKYIDCTVIIYSLGREAVIAGMKEKIDDHDKKMFEFFYKKATEEYGFIHVENMLKNNTDMFISNENDRQNPLFFRKSYTQTSYCMKLYKDESGALQEK